MLIAIGSTNPVKLKAAQKALIKAFADAEFISTQVNSGVSNQPIGDPETRTGALNRAKQALDKLKADYGVGLEGGVIDTEIGMMSTAWCAIINNNGKTSFGGGMHFHIPDNVAIRIRNGEELGPIMDKITGIKNSKKKGGAVEVFTNGIVDRATAYQRLVELALSKFVASKWF